MIAKSTKYAVCFGIAGGLAIALAPTTHAQTTTTSAPAPTTTSTTSTQSQSISITGGMLGGQAAFFSPIQSQTTTGTTAGTSSPVLFDAAVTTLQLQTTSGNTSTARFVPQAADFKDVGAGNVGRPGKDDTGTFIGTLSGLAFTSQGAAVPFSNIATTLSFTLNSFGSSAFLGGSLITPKEIGSAPLIFLPVTDVQLSTQSEANYTAKSGVLEVGNFEGNLTAGKIGLPTSLKFNGGGAVTLPPSTSLGQKTKFELEGEGFGTLSSTFSDQPDTTQSSTSDDDGGTQDGTTATGTQMDGTTTATNTTQTTGDTTTTTSTPTTGDTATTTSTDTTTGDTATTTDSDDSTSSQITTASGTDDAQTFSSTNKVAFSSNNAQTKFKVEGEKFKIEGTGVGTDIKLGGTTKLELTNPSAFSDSAIKFKVTGEGNGITTINGNSTVGYLSDNSKTQFEFGQEGATAFKLKGESQGRTQFTVGAVASQLGGTSGYDVATGNTSYQSSSTSYSSGAGANTSQNTGFGSKTSLSYNATFQNGGDFSTVINNSSGSFGGGSIGTGSSGGTSGGGSFGGTSGGSTGGSTGGGTSTGSTGGSTGGSSSGSGSGTSTSAEGNGSSLITIYNNTTFNLISLSNAFIRSSQQVYNASTNSGQVGVFVEKGRSKERLLVVRQNSQGLALGTYKQKKGRAVAAYKQVGPESRLFGGMMGLRQISTEEVSNVEGDAGAEETSTTTETQGTTQTTPSTVAPGEPAPTNTTEDDATTTPAPEADDDGDDDGDDDAETSAPEADDDGDDDGDDDAETSAPEADDDGDDDGDDDAETSAPEADDDGDDDDASTSTPSPTTGGTEGLNAIPSDTTAPATQQ